jgi:acetyl esterase/lipase
MRNFFFVFQIFLAFLLSGCSKDTSELPLKPPGGYWNMTTIKIAYFLGMIDEIQLEFPVPDNITEIKDLVYITVDSTYLHLDIYYPKNILKKQPLLLFIHGGGLSKGNKKDYLFYTVAFAQRGYVTATVQYRFVDEVKYPEQVYEVISAVRWLEKNADSFHIDTSKIALIGGSVGGLLAVMVGYSADIDIFKAGVDSVSYNVEAVVDLYGPVDFTTPYAREHSIVKRMFGKTYDEEPDIYKKYSPLSFVSSDDPPTLVFQGTIDDLAPVSRSDTLVSRLKKAGVPVEYHRLKGWPHAMYVEVSVSRYC